MTPTSNLPTMSLDMPNFSFATLELETVVKLRVLQSMMLVKQARRHCLVLKVRRRYISFLKNKYIMPYTCLAPDLGDVSMAVSYL